jgi:hypothetical protein
MEALQLITCDASHRTDIGVRKMDYLASALLPDRGRDASHHGDNKRENTMTEDITARESFIIAEALATAILRRSTRR